MATGLADCSSSATRNEELDSTDTSDDDIPVESLVAGRSRRATAGNRMNLLRAQQADEDIDLLFAEDGDEEDAEFEAVDVEATSEVELESSDDDEDQGPAAEANDLQGERELQIQARANERKIRKAQTVFKGPRPSRAKAKIAAAESGQTTTTTLRPKKKSERVSWLPTPDEGPLRASSRKQTVLNKTIVHQRMQENEKRRRRQIKVMEAATKRREAAKPKAMTQSDRMAEATRVEKSNAKSLNRWEAAEEKRLEEQKARLAALQNRKLDGPVITWWSGPSKWFDDKLTVVGSKQVVPVVGKSLQASSGQIRTSSPLKATTIDSTKSDTDTIMVDTTPLLAVQVSRNVSEDSHGGLDEICQVARTIEVTESNSHEVEGDSNNHHAVLDRCHPTHRNVLPFSPSDVSHPLLPRPSQSTPQLVAETATRNLVILDGIDVSGLESQALGSLGNVITKKARIRLAKAERETCAITNQPARFRDPKTGLPYASILAYQEIQKLRNNTARWSGLLECYVGSRTMAAAGAPEKFYAHHTP